MQGALMKQKEDIEIRKRQIACKIVFTVLGNSPRFKVGKEMILYFAGFKFNKTKVSRWIYNQGVQDIITGGQLLLKYSLFYRKASDGILPG